MLAFVLWTVALKHTLVGSGSAGQGKSSGAYQSAINQAKGLQAVVNSAAAKAGGTPGQSAAPTHGAGTATAAPGTTSTPTTPGTPQPAQKPAGSGSRSAPGASAAGSAATASHGATSLPQSPKARTTGVALVGQALDQHKVLALLFYNPAAPDDREVHAELSAIPTHAGKVVKLAVPLPQLGAYASLLNQMPVNFSPTLILINRDRKALEIAGFADSFEIAQRVAVALHSAAPKT